MAVQKNLHRLLHCFPKLEGFFPLNLFHNSWIFRDVYVATDGDGLSMRVLKVLRAGSDLFSVFRAFVWKILRHCLLFFIRSGLTVSVSACHVKTDNGRSAAG